MFRSSLLYILASVVVAFSCSAGPGTTPALSAGRLEPIRRVVDLSIGESRAVELGDGTTATVELIATACEKDFLIGAVRMSTATVAVNSDTVTLHSAMYNLPVRAGGVRLDCPVTRHLYEDSGRDSWALEGDARIRLWPAEGPLIHARAFRYPLDQRWLSCGGQMSNEVSYVNGCENPLRPYLYYHAGLDFGGCEGQTAVLAASPGMVIQKGEEVLAGYEDHAPEMRYESLYILGAYGWLFRYSHLHSFAEGLEPGDSVRLGQPVGYLGKEGNSGGWAHLHFEVFAPQPSGEWGVEESYAYVWQSYVNEHDPPLLAVARPHIVAQAGDTVTLDGTRSWIAEGGRPARYEWSLSDGSVAAGPVHKLIYSEPGQYSETLKVTSGSGAVDYDFQLVYVMDREYPEEPLPAVHSAFHPTLRVSAGDEVTFRVRSFNTPETVTERIDFGDGSAPLELHSEPCYLWYHPAYTETGMASKQNETLPRGYAATTHAYESPGDYIVTVESVVEGRVVATDRLHVRIGAH